MVDHPIAIRMLADDARSLLTRLRRVKSFALNETMVPAAALSLQAQTAIERQLAGGRCALRRRVNDYLRWLDGPGGRAASPRRGSPTFRLAATDLQRRSRSIRYVLASDHAAERE